jgi:pilus assembly protein CpaB
MPAPTLTPVVAAAGAVPFGQKLEAKNLTVIQMPAGAVPEGAYHSIQQVVGLDGGGPVTLTALVNHEPILPTKVSGGGAKPSVAATISPGMRAYTIKVNDVAGGGGHVLPGDRVDVLLVQEISDKGAVEGASATKLFISTLVLQNVRVLGMDLIADPASTEKFPPKTATLEVGVLDAGKLAAAGEAGILSLSLRRSGATDVTEVRPMTLPEMLRSDRWAGVSPATRAARSPPGPTHAVGAVDRPRHPRTRRHPGRQAGNRLRAFRALRELTSCVASPLSARRLSPARPSPRPPSARPSSPAPWSANSPPAG